MCNLQLTKTKLHQTEKSNKYTSRHVSFVSAWPADQNLQVELLPPVPAKQTSISWDVEATIICQKVCPSSPVI